jgi:hypothetical protein
VGRSTLKQRIVDLLSLVELGWHTFVVSYMRVRAPSLLPDIEKASGIPLAFCILERASELSTEHSARAGLLALGARATGRPCPIQRGEVNQYGRLPTTA